MSQSDSPRSVEPMTEEERQAMAVNARAFFDRYASWSDAEIEDAYPQSFARHRLALRYESSLSSALSGRDEATKQIGAFKKIAYDMIAERDEARGALAFSAMERESVGERLASALSENERLRTELPCEGDRSCGKPIPHGEEYRCLDCGSVMHKVCLRDHCGGDEKDRLIGMLQRTIAARDVHTERLLSEADATLAKVQADLALCSQDREALTAIASGIDGIAEHLNCSLFDGYINELRVIAARSTPLLPNTNGESHG